MKEHLLNRVSTGTTAKLSTEARQLISESIADNTRLAYKKDITRFLDFGECGFPASPEDVANYIAGCADTHKPSTLERWLVSIGRLHTTKGYDNPCTTETVRSVLKGIRRTKSTKQRRVSPVLIDDLLKIVGAMSDNERNIRDRAIILLGFSGALRRSEIVALSRDSFSFRGNAMIVELAKSKTNQAGAPDIVGIGRAKNPLLCPIMAVQEWLKVNPRDCPFPGINKWGFIEYENICDRTVARIVKKHCQLAGIDEEAVSGHSLRAGYATSAALQGVPIWRIKRQTRHKKIEMLDIYIRDAESLRAGSIL